MSGLEVAGLVLGLFPIVISAIDSCERGYGVLADWKHFRREFTEVSNRLRGQQILLRQHIEVALRSIVDSESSLTAMMDKPGSTAWQESELTSRLKMKLSGTEEFDTYCFTLNTTYVLLKKLDKRLQVHGNVVKPTAGATKINVQKEFRKLQFCFQKKKLAEEVIVIGEHIDILGKLLGNAEVLEPTRRTRQSAMSQVFEQVRNQASSLHRAISRAWTCSCSERHAFELLLTRKKNRSNDKRNQDTSDRKLHVAFPLKEPDYDSKLQHLYQHTTPHLPSSLFKSKHSWCMTETTMMVKDLTEGEQTLQRSGPRLEISQSASSVYSDKASTLVDSEDRMKKMSVVSTETLIEDLCGKIKIWDKSEPFLGHLPDGLGAHHSLHIARDLGALTKGINRVISLHDILNGSSGQIKPMSRATRISVALIISYALLELHSSPWLQDKWDKSDIYFWIEEQGTVITDHPFLVSVTEIEKAKSQGQRNSDTLLSLGILIMELWFNQPLEAQPFWAANFGPEGKETEFTRFSAAATWQRKVSEDAGIRLHSITRRCIYCDFGLDTQDLGDRSFTRAVYDGVVKELESFVAMFEQS